VAISPPPSPKKYERKPTGYLEFSWREKMNNRLKLINDFLTTDLTIVGTKKKLTAFQ
jgi:hypothetical protein